MQNINYFGTMNCKMSNFVGLCLVLSKIKVYLKLQILHVFFINQVKLVAQKLKATINLGRRQYTQLFGAV